jgi:hypothetical protein
VSLNRRFTKRELLLAWAALGLLGVLTYLPHILHGGFYLDDWSNGALALNNPDGNSFGNVISTYAETTNFRPVLIVYVPATYWVFGMHLWLHLAWASLLAIAVAWFLYAVLRKLDVPWIHALALAGLVLVYPWFDSTRLWITGDQITLSTALALGGLWLSLIGMERRSWNWHIPAMLLFGLSILTYEITTPAIAAFGVIYVWRFGWERARWVWGANLGVVIVCGSWVLSHTTRTKQGLSGDFDHLWMIVKGGGEIVGRSLLPVGPVRTGLALALLGLVFGAGVIALWRAPRLFLRGPGLGLRGWLLLGGAGLALTVLGWIVFVPADPYYTPTIYGVTNRVNGIGGIASIILVYAAFGVAGTLVSRLARGRRAAPIALAVTVGLGAALGALYLTVIHRHIGIWNSAYQQEKEAIAKIRDTYPTLPDGTTLYTTDYPAYQTYGVPILSSSWDLDGMIKNEYESGKLAAFPLLDGYRFSCDKDGLSVLGPPAEGAPNAELMKKRKAYGTVRVLSLGQERAFEPRNQAQCKRDVEHLEPGPLVEQYGY